MFFPRKIHRRQKKLAGLPMRYQPCTNPLYEKLLHLFLKSFFLNG